MRSRFFNLSCTDSSAPPRATEYGKLRDGLSDRTIHGKEKKSRVRAPYCGVGATGSPPAKGVHRQTLYVIGTGSVPELMFSLGSRRAACGTGGRMMGTSLKGARNGRGRSRCPLPPRNTALSAVLESISHCSKAYSLAISRKTC